MHLSTRNHILPAIAALTVLVLGGWNAKILLDPLAQISSDADLQTISVLHSNPASIRFEYGTKNKSAIVVIENGEEQLSIIIPANWELREYRGLSTEDQSNNSTGLNMIKLEMPANSSMQFWLKKAPKHLVVHNSKDSFLKIEFIQINMETEKITNDVFLVDNSPLQLW